MSGFALAAERTLMTLTANVAKNIENKSLDCITPALYLKSFLIDDFFVVKI